MPNLVQFVNNRQRKLDDDCGGEICRLPEELLRDDWHFIPLSLALFLKQYSFVEKVENRICTSI